MGLTLDAARSRIASGGTPRSGKAEGLRRLALAVATALAALLFPSSQGAATTIVPPRDLGELVRSSHRVALAVAGPSATHARGQLFFTTTHFEVEEWIAGPELARSSILVEVPGGEVDGTGWLVPGIPRFEEGGRYLLFLDRRPDGSWAPKVASWGILREEAGQKGIRLLAPLPESKDLVVYPRPDGLPSESPGTYRFERLAAHLRRMVAEETGWDGSLALALSTEAVRAPASLAIPQGCAFMTASGGSPLRRKVFDTGGSVAIAALSSGDPSISGGGFSEVQSAIEVWMGVPNTRLKLTYGGPRAYSMTCTAGQDTPGSDANIVMFNDPCSDIPDLSGCSGVLGFGGPWYSGTHTFDGMTWTTVFSWFVVLNNGVGCIGSQNYRLMVAHEMGHGLGFGHVSDPNALMNLVCCHDPNSTDTTCAQYAYPGSTPTSCTGFSISPSSASATASAGSRLVTVTGSPSGCTGSWTASGNGSWITVNPGSGNGNGSTTVSWTANGASSSRSGTATIAGSTFTVSQSGLQLPVASFTFSPASPATGQTVQFTDASTNGPTSWAWDFGDPSSGGSNTSALQNPAHLFASAGTFDVTLRVVNAFGTGLATRTVGVTTPGEAPTAAFDFSPSNPRPGALVQFADTSTGGPTSWAWSFDDPSSGSANSSTAQNPEHTYSAVGSYSALLTATNAHGSTSTSRNVTVSQAVVSVERFVPIVLDLVGSYGAQFSSELVLANRGGSRAKLEVTYTPAAVLGSSGGGTVTHFLEPGEQKIFGNAISWLRLKGLSIPTVEPGSPPQGGTLRVKVQGSVKAEDVAVLARTTSLSGPGRAGLSYGSIDSTDPGSAAVYLFGLREGPAERSNLALANVGKSGTVSLRVTLYPGPGGTPFVLPNDSWLAPGQWMQIGQVLTKAGFASGFAKVERVSGSEPFTAYAVYNDNVTQDGSFVAPVPTGRVASTWIIPAVVEVPPRYESEMVLANPNAFPVDVTLAYVESFSTYAPRAVAVTRLGAWEQKIVPSAMDTLRTFGVDVGSRGGTYAGSLTVAFKSSGAAVDGFAGARTSAPGPAGGFYGVAYPGMGTADEAASGAWVYGLKQDGESRSNLAVVNSRTTGDAIGVRCDVYDGLTGQRAGETAVRTLPPGKWTQFDQVMRDFGVANGYVRVTKVSGTSPFVSYGVVNDGGSSGAGTNDGSFVPAVPER